MPSIQKTIKVNAKRTNQRQSVLDIPALMNTKFLTSETKPNHIFV